MTQTLRSDEQISAELAALARARDVQGIERYAAQIAEWGTLPPRTAVAIGQAMRDAGDEAAAIDWFSKVKPSDKPYEFARAQTARILLGHREFEKVLSITAPLASETMSEGLATSHLRALAGLGRNSEALEFLHNFTRARRPTASLLEAAADAAVAEGGWVLALPLVEKAIATNNEPRFHLRRAIGLFQLERTEEALHELSDLSRLDDFFVRAKTVMLRIYVRSMSGDQIVQTCEEILTRVPDNEFALETLIRHHIEERDYRSAEIAYANAAAIKPKRFIREMFDFLVRERQGQLRKGLAPFKEDTLDECLPDEVKERIANAFYSSGQFHPARRLARQLPEDRQAILKGKIALAVGKSIRSEAVPDSFEGRLVASLASYLEGNFDECLSKLEGVEGGKHERLGVMNFRYLANSRRLLSNQFFARAEGVPNNMSAPLPAVRQLWIGSKLSYIERLSIRSFLAAGHQTYLYTYDSDIDAPPGCVVVDAAEILPRDRIFAHSSVTGRSKGSLAGFADLFRWKLLHQHGGLWADCDVVCIKPITSPRIVSTELARIGTLVLPAITNCLFGAEAGELAFGQAYEDSAGLDNSQLLWGEIGIHKMAELVASESWGERLTAPSDLCPIPPFRMIDAIQGAFDVQDIVERTGCRAIHLYNEVMRMVNLSKEGPFPDHGIIGVLERMVSASERARLAKAALLTAAEVGR